MKVFTTTLLFVFVFQWSFSQSELSGKVITDDMSALSYVNITVHEHEDEKFVKGTISSEDGTFKINDLPSGKYKLAISMVGYSSHRVDIFLNDGQNDLGIFTLEEDNAVLDEVAIIAQKPLFERQSDRLIVNVQNTITNVGSNALQILEQSPGIGVNRVNNTISMMGKNGLIITINGKRTRLDADALIQMLASTPSSNIQKIELIQNPPANFDAQGDAGVINIVMIKSDTQGFNGNINVMGGYGFREKYGGGLNFNYKNKSVNLYGHINTNTDYTSQGVTLTQKVQYENTLIDSRQINDRPASLANHSAKIGTDILLTDDISLNSFISGSFRRWKLDALSTTDFNVPVNDIIQQQLASNEENNTDHYMISNNIRYNIGKKSTLSVDYDYLNYNITNPTAYALASQNQIDETISSTFESSKRTPFDFHVGKVDYSNEIASTNIEAGLKFTISDVLNSTRLTYLETTPVNDPFFTNDITLNEKIFAAYISGKRNINAKNEISAGLRYELYNVSVSTDSNDKLIDRNKGRYFPNVSWNYAASEVNSFSLFFNSRINRPGFQILAPAFYFLDANTVLGGNIEALPTVSKNVGANINLGTLFISLTYSDEDEPLTWGQAVLNNESNNLLLVTNNTLDKDILTLTLSKSMNLTDSWSARINLNALYQKEKIQNIGDQLSINSTLVFGNINQTWKISDTWSAELSSTFNTQGKFGFSTWEPRFSSNFGIQKSLKNGAKLSVNWNDIFDTGSFFNIVTDVPNQQIYYDWLYELEGNIFRLTFSTPFGNKALKTKDKRKSGAEEEINRAQN